MEGQPAVSGVEEVRTLDDLERLRPEWDALYRSVGLQNPFASPLWQIEWARHFTVTGEVRVLAVRAQGRLVGVAPLFIRGYGPGGKSLLTRGRLVGMGRHANLTELPSILIEPGSERSVLRQVHAHLLGGDRRWDWVEIVLSPSQGWFEPEWLGGGSGPAFAVHSGAHVCVVLPLPDDWETLRQSLKRNVRESIRRSTNRLRRDGHEWRLRVHEGAAVTEGALAQLVSLHEARAAAQDRHPHRNFFVSATHREFLDSVMPQLTAAGMAKIAVLEVGDRPVAAALLLRANGGVYFSATGIDPAWWDYGVGTLLTSECLRDAVESGDRLANLSTGPTVAKLRWSERLEQHNRFDIVNARLGSRLAYGTFVPLRAAFVIARRGKQGRSPKATGDYDAAEGPSTIG